MITTIFSKSSPFNYILITLMLILCFFLVQIQEVEATNTTILILFKVGLLVVIIASLFVTNFVSKRNGLSKDSTFPFLFFFCFVILFPTTFDKAPLIVSNFCILLALRRLISLQSLITPKEKIFDASLLIFVAALFHFWSLLFIILVFISIILHVSRDYRNWILPYIAFFAVGFTFVLFALLIDKSLLFKVVENRFVSFDFNYFTNQFQNIALSIYAAIAVLFLVSLVMSISKKSLLLHASYKKIIVAFVIGVAIYIISPNKNNGFLIYTFMPMAVMATSYIEGVAVKWIKELTMSIIVVLCFLSFVLQL